MKIRNKKQLTPSEGYYEITIKAEHKHRYEDIISSNSERASILVNLQDILGENYDPPGKNILIDRLNTNISLLGFSINRNRVSLVVFSLSHADAANLSVVIINNLSSFQEESAELKQLAPMNARIKKLLGPHDALQRCSKLHASHTAWEYDKYSSIGFYLNERKGSWMDIWRLSKLYNNDPEEYRLIVSDIVKRQPKSRSSNPIYHAPLRSM